MGGSLMDRRYRTVIFPLVLALVILFVHNVAAAGITGRLADQIAADGPAAQQRVLLLVDSGGVADRPIALSPAARARRARVGTSAPTDWNDYSVDDRVVDAVRATGVRIHGVSRWLKAVIVDATPDQIAQLAALPSISQVDLDRTLRATMPASQRPSPRESPPAHSAAYDYGLSLAQNRFLNVIKLHNAGLTGSGVTIAVLDGGFDYTHRAFDSAHVVATWDFINNDATVDEPDCPTDYPTRWQNYHGTLVLGTLAALTPDTLVGTAPGADYLLAKTEITCFGTEIEIEETNWILAAEWADSAGADIITSSLGYITFQDAPGYTYADLNGHTARITLAAEIAASKNILVICSAGNDRQTTWGHIDFPADGDSVIAVGAVRFDSTLAPFSSPGPTSDGRIKPDIVTVGVGVSTTVPDDPGFNADGWTTGFSGTSASAPLVAGAAALALEHAPTLTADDLRTLIRGTGSLASNPNNDYGFGIFDAVRTADIIRVVAPRRASVALADTATVTVLTEGTSSVTPTLDAFNLPSHFAFTDNGDGTGQLEIVGEQSAAIQEVVGLTANVGYFIDTAYITIETTAPSRDAVVAAPNPFSDELTLFVAGSAGEWRSVTIFNAAGESVWEQVNNSPLTSDSIIRWNGTNAAGKRVAPGVYVAVVSTARTTAIVKVLKTN